MIVASIVSTEIQLIFCPFEIYFMVEKIIFTAAFVPDIAKHCSTVVHMQVMGLRVLNYCTPLKLKFYFILSPCVNS